MRSDRHDEPDFTRPNTPTPVIGSCALLVMSDAIGGLVQVLNNGITTSGTYRLFWSSLPTVVPRHALCIPCAYPECCQKMTQVKDPKFQWRASNR